MSCLLSYFFFVLSLELFASKMFSTIPEIDLFNDIKLLFIEHILEELTIVGFLKVVEERINDLVTSFQIHLTRDYLFEVKGFLLLGFLFIFL